MSEQVRFNQVILKSADKFLGFCPELSITVESASLESTRKALNEGVRNLLVIAQKDRQLTTLLQDAGYTKSGNEWTSPGIAETGTDSVSI